MLSPVNVHIGKRLKTLRIEKQISQTQLGNVVGVTFQQVQKYESGMSRISIEYLLAFCRFLDVPLSYFMDGLIAPRNEDSSHQNTTDLLDKRDAVQLIRYFSQIEDREKRSAILAITKQMVPERSMQR